MAALPVHHTEREDCLPETHPLANEDVTCTSCGRGLHAWNNELMREWVETDHGNFCDPFCDPPKRPKGKR